MPACPDVDRLVALSHADDDPLELIRHLASCDTCRDRLADAALIRVSLSTTDPRPGFADEVMDALGQAASEEPAPPPTVGSRATWPWRLAGGVFGAGTAVAALAATGAAVPVSPSPTALVGVLLAGVAGIAVSGDRRQA